MNEDSNTLVKIEEILFGKNEQEAEIINAKFNLIDRIYAAFGTGSVSPSDANEIIQQDKSGIITHIKLRLQVNIVKLRDLTHKKEDLAEQLKTVFENELAILNDIETEFLGKARADGLTRVDGLWIGTHLQIAKLKTIANKLNVDKAAEKNILTLVNKAIYKSA